MTARAIAAAVFLGVGSAAAAETRGSQPPAAAVGTALTLPATSDLPRLLDLAALRLGASIDYDPLSPMLKGQQVTLRGASAGGVAAAAMPGGAAGGGVALGDAELWSTVSRILVQRGLTTVRSPGSASLTVVKLEDAARLARLEPVVTLDAGVVAAGELAAGFRNQPVRLRHVSLKEAGEALRAVQRGGSGSGSGSGVNAGSGGGVGGAGGAASGDLLLLSDISPRIEEQLAVLRQLDTAENATVVQGVTVSNVAPVQLAAAVMQLASKRESVSGEKLAGEVIAGGTGAVTVIAPRRSLERWKQLVSLADAREGVTTQTYSPRLFSVREVASLIQQIAGTAGGTGGAGGAGGGGGGG